MVSRKLILLTAVLTLITSSAFAQNWRGLLHDVDNDLRTQHYEHARKWSIKVIDSLSDHLGTGPNASYTMALTVAYRALAEKGLGKDDDADWYWHVANSIYPDIAKHDWSPYGEVGAWAANHTDDYEVGEAPAVPMQRLKPKCPLSAIVGGYYQPIKVGAIVDSSGIARCPSLEKPTQAPTLAYAAFEALKNWKFQAAAPTKYELIVDFQPPAN